MSQDKQYIYNYICSEKAQGILIIRTNDKMKHTPDDEISGFSTGGHFPVGIKSRTCYLVSSGVAYLKVGVSKQEIFECTPYWGTKSPISTPNLEYICYR